MFGWLKNIAYKPVAPQADPGWTSRIALNQTGTEEAAQELDLVTLLATALRKHGYRPQRRSDWLAMPGGLLLQPRFLSLDTRADGSVHTVTTVSVCHREVLPKGLFEYQHAVGNDVQAAIEEGLDLWVQLDLAVLSEAVSGKYQQCTRLEFNFPGAEDRSPFSCEVVLGPTMHFARHADAQAEEEHPFCPCCLFTNSMAAFERLLQEGGFSGIRLFASRNDEGKAEADCRVDGVDWEAGAEALVGYVETWPQRGVEFRKQYVVVRGASKRRGPEAQTPKKAVS